jgi:CBS domain-containing protein
MNPNKPIRSIMSKQLITVGPEDEMHVVERIFHENTFHHLPVVGNGQILEGIISREDWLRVAHFLSMREKCNGTVFDGTNVTASDIMTRFPLFLDPEDTIGLAADIFMSNKFHALPIVEDEKLVGIVTTHDLLKYSFTSPIEREEWITD